VIDILIFLFNGLGAHGNVITCFTDLPAEGLQLFQIGLQDEIFLSYRCAGKKKFIDIDGEGFRCGLFTGLHHELICAGLRAAVENLEEFCGKTVSRYRISVPKVGWTTA